MELFELVVDGYIVIMVEDGGVVIGVIQEVVWIVEWQVVEQVFDGEVQVLCIIWVLGDVYVGGLL